MPFLPCRPIGLAILGIENLNVARTIGRLLDRGSLTKPSPLAKDGDLVALAHHMIRTRGRHTVRVTKVTGHATDVDVGLGRVRIEDKLGNAEADTTADIGRRHQTELLIDVRRGLLQARTHWYPVMQQLHRFMIAVSRVAVNHLILWFGIREELGRRVRLTLGLMSTLLLCLGHVVS